MKNFSIISTSIVMLIMVVACNNLDPLDGTHEPILPAVPFDYLSVNEDLSEFTNSNSIDVAGEQSIILPGMTFFRGSDIESNELATLGRVLFYDNRLSKNNSISCASCHDQTAGFADKSSVSPGFGGGMTSRNSMALANPIFNETFFWDGRTRSLGDLALQPVFNHVEMGMNDFKEVATKINAEPYYNALFTDAFGFNNVTEENVSKALASFVSSIFKADSKFDDGLKNEFENFSPLEKHGMALFFSQETQCSSCHSGANFSTPTGFNNPYEETSGTTNIGLDLVYDDPGFASGKFKIPSLRNVALSAPYMHDGRFSDLRGVLDHYNEGIAAHNDLDSKLIVNGQPRKMHLTDLDLDAMEAFLNTLTSASLATDTKYSNPFK